MVQRFNYRTVEEIMDVPESKELHYSEKSWDEERHTGQPYKIKIMKFANEMIQIIFSYLNNKTFQVKFKDTNSKSKSLHQEYHKAQCSPHCTIYIIYGSDFLCRPGSKLVQFTDDTHPSKKALIIAELSFN